MEMKEMKERLSSKLKNRILHNIIKVYMDHNPYTSSIVTRTECIQKYQRYNMNIQATTTRVTTIDSS